MTVGPDATLQFYAGEAQAYANRGHVAQLERLAPFCDRLPAGGRILELGCGGGEDSEAMLKRGFDVSPTDGTPEMAAMAQQRLGRPVRVLRFEDISEIEAYDGVWACACLLHVPRPDLADVLARIRQALKPAGLFYASYKAGSEEGFDRLGRYYNRPDETFLSQTYRQAGWSDIAMDREPGSGYDGEPTDWLHVTAVR